MISAEIGNINRGFMNRAVKITITLFIPVLCMASDGSGDFSQSLFPAAFPGFVSLKNKDYDSALKQVLEDSVVEDTIQRIFRLATIHHRQTDYSKSLFLYRLAAQKNAVVAPLAFKFIGDIEFEQGRVSNSLTSYRAALGYRMPQKYRYHIYGKIRSVLENDSTGLMNADWLEEYRKWAAPQVKTVAPALSDTVDTMVIKGNWRAVDSLLDTIKLKGADGCRIAKIVLKADSQYHISGNNLLSLASAAVSCKDWKTANVLLNRIADKKGVLKKVPEGKYLYLRAQVSYELGRFEDAIKYYKKIESGFGSDANVFMNLARSYRKLGKEVEADKWYERHVKEYPSHSRNLEILWHLGWRKEEEGKIGEAKVIYKTIYTKYPKSSRRDESYLRHALCDFRMEKYDSALSILDGYIKKNPFSPIKLSVSYWKGKCLLALNRTSEAGKVFSEIHSKEPYDYYAHRSRQMLSLLGDTADFQLDTIPGLQRAFDWLDSISPVKGKKVLSPEDSADYVRGVYLVSIGETAVAEMFLEKLEESFPANLKLQLELAMLYFAGDSPAQAYRVSRRLTWRIPEESRSRMPVALYRFLYPPYFADIIETQAAEHNVDPYLVSAVIRQESIFNPSIKSPVGAIGLMQIMPYTGKYIAEKVDVAYTNDSLVCPIYNIRFGTWYIRELLDQFNENVVLALASYNGGPHNAQKWYNNNKEEEYDLFIEDIAFSETRGYVKKVLANYWTYRILAGNPGFGYSAIKK